MLRYAITDSLQLGSDYATRRDALMRQVKQWVDAGINFIQLREKDLAAGNLFHLAQHLCAITRDSDTKLLVNSRADVAAAVGADGVHLTSHADELRADQVRRVFSLAGQPAPFVSRSCHTLPEVANARGSGVDLILYGPVFEKRVRNDTILSGTGLDLLRSAVPLAGAVPVYALGGVTLQNVSECLEAGAAGVAAIRLFR